MALNNVYKNIRNKQFSGFSQIKSDAEKNYFLDYLNYKILF